jgi:hypothetical protein
MVNWDPAKGEPLEPYNMPNLALSDSQIANEAAYVFSLRTRR